MEIWQIMKLAAREWWVDKAPRLGAALAFYSLLSLGPLFLIAIAVAGAVFGEEAAKGQLISQVGGLVGDAGAEAIELVLANSRKPEANVTAALIGLATLLFSASGVFGELQDGLNTIWDAKSKPAASFMRILRKRFTSFTMVLGIGFLLMVSLVITAILSAISNHFTGMLPDFEYVLLIIDFLITFSGITLLFGLIFKILPDVRLRWRDVWLGSIVSAGLFTAGKFLIGLYLGRSAIASTYGAAGSVIVLAIWVYYSAQILYFGAELTKAYVERRQSQRRS